MSIITLQFGQCGNQIGSSLYKEIYNDIKTEGSKVGVNNKVNIDYVADSVKKWFNVTINGAWNVRSILIDTENKVVSNVNNNGFYKFRNIVAKSHGGAANNWAFGYASKSALLLSDIREGIRKELEKDGGVSTIMAILGSAGGTGSGVGSKTLEVVRDDYPKKLITSVVVLPYKRGEVVTQNYNTLLTLASLNSTNDGIYLYGNDIMHRMCSKFLSTTNITFHTINSIIAQQLTATFQPLEDCTVWSIVKDLISHPSYKLIQIKSAPHIAEEHLKFEALPTWHLLVNQVKNGIKLDSQDSSATFNKKIKSTGNTFISRGYPNVTRDNLRLLSDSISYVRWIPSHCTLSTFHHNRSFRDVNKFVTFLTNNSYVCTALDNVLNDAWTLFNSRAYLHHYQRYNIDEQFFADSFNKFEDMYESYKNL